jgi:hypothetical protein
MPVNIWVASNRMKVHYKFLENFAGFHEGD